MDNQSQEIFCDNKGKNYPLEIEAFVLEHSNLMGGGQAQQYDGGSLESDCLDNKGENKH